jgi:hypothetical protein
MLRQNRQVVYIHLLQVNWGPILLLGSARAISKPLLALSPDYEIRRRPQVSLALRRF